MDFDLGYNLTPKGCYRMALRDYYGLGVRDGVGLGVGVSVGKKDGSPFHGRKRVNVFASSFPLISARCRL